MIRYYIILTFLVLTNFVNAQLTAGLTAYWGLDEESGTIVDSVGSNDGTVTGATYEATGKLNTCLSFDGNGDYITFPDGADLQGNGDDFGMGAWIYPTQYSGDDYRHIFGGEEYAFGMAINAISEALVMRVIGAYSSPSSSFTVPLNQWSFVYCQIDYSETTNDVDLYYNGTMNTVTFNHDAISGTSTNLIGCREVGHDYFIGKIDDSFVTKTLKTEAQLDSIYNLGIGKIYPWDFSEGTGLESDFIRSGTVQSMWRIDVQKVAFRIPYEQGGEEEETEIFGYHMDGTCPESTHRWDDYDCAINDFTHATNVALIDTNDCTEVIYINPNVNDGGDGTLNDPYNEWSDITSFTNNYAYVQLRGTTATITSILQVGTSISQRSTILIGSYGDVEDAKPIIYRSNTGGIIDAYCNNLAVRDIHLKGVSIALHTFTPLVFLHGNSDESFIYNCEFEQYTSGIYTYGSDNRFINCVFHDLWLDAIWMAEADYIEVAHNNIYDINKAYEIDHDVGVAGGDGLQFEKSWSQAWIHDNYVDKHDDGNKACMMLMNNGSPYRYDERCIVEFNELHGPLHDVDGYPGASLNCGDAENFLVQYNKFYGYEGTEDANTALTNFSDNDTIQGNIFVGYSQALYGGGANAIIANNTFYDNDEYIAVNIDGKFYNNIFSVPDGASSFSGVNLDDESNNLFTITVPVGWVGSFHGNPHYTDSLSNDFTLQSNSDAIDAGIALDHYNYDITKKEITGTIDCGAYEYNLWLLLIFFIPIVFKKFWT